VKIDAMLLRVEKARKEITRLQAQIDSDRRAIRDQVDRLFPRSDLTPRRRQILQMVQRNMANKEIASELNISERTVKFHVSDLLAIFGVDSRYKLIAMHTNSGER